MKIALIVVTCLAVAAAAVLGVVAGKTCAAKTHVEEERDALAEQVEELDAGRAARAGAFVALMAIAPGPEGDEEAGETLSGDYLERCRQFLVQANGRISPPFPEHRLTVKLVIEEMGRQLEFLKRLTGDWKTKAENL